MGDGVLGQLIGSGPDTGAPDSPLIADNIDPATRDFADLDVGMDPIDAQVLVALTTVRGSGAAVFEDGVDPAPRKMGDALADELESNVRRALRRLVRAGDIQLVSVLAEVIDHAHQYAQQRVEYVNLRSGRRVTTTAPLPVPGAV